MSIILALGVDGCNDNLVIYMCTSLLLSMHEQRLVKVLGHCTKGMSSSMEHESSCTAKVVILGLSSLFCRR